MLTEQEKSLLPIIHSFQTDKFNVKLQLTYSPKSEELYIIELHHKERQNQVHVCQINLEKIRNNGHLHLFERPSNLFLQMTAVLDDIRISEYGEIEFYMSLGKKSKFPVTLYATRKGVDSDQYIKKEKELFKSIELNTALHQKYAENAAKIMLQIRQLNKQTRQIPDRLRILSRVLWQYTLQEKYKNQCETIRQGLIRALEQHSD